MLEELVVVKHHLLIKDKATGLTSLARSQVDRCYLSIFFRYTNVNLVALLIHSSLCHGSAILESMEAITLADVRLSLTKSLYVLIDDSRDRFFSAVSSSC